MQERNRTLDTILRQYENFVKPCYDMYCLPTKKYADIVLPRGEENIGNVCDRFVTKTKHFYSRYRRYYQAHSGDSPLAAHFTRTHRTKAQIDWRAYGFALMQV